MKKYIIYKITNDINGMFYYGKHVTNNIDDSYLGSGVYLKRAIEKYGKEHFHKEIIAIFDNEEDMNNKEREIVTEDLVNNPLCYNIMLGGEGGDTWTNSGRHHSDETKNKLSEISKNNWTDRDIRDHIIQSLKDAFAIKKANHPDLIEAEYKKRGVSISKSLHGCSESRKNAISIGLKKYFDKVGRKHKVREHRELQCLEHGNKRTYVNNGEKEIRIYIEELPWYVDNGWKTGRCIKKEYKFTSEKSKVSSSGKGKVYIFNPETQESKRISNDDLKSYIDAGWIRGYKTTKR